MFLILNFQNVSLVLFSYYREQSNVFLDVFIFIILNKNLTLTNLIASITKTTFNYFCYSTLT